MENIIESYINDFVEAFGFQKEAKTVQFEHFVNYITLPKVEDTRESIESVSVGEDGNPGSDGIAIVVNDHIVKTKEQVDFILNNLGRMEVEFYFVQAKTSDGFSMAEVSSYIGCVTDFFNEKSSFKFNDETVRLIELKNYLFTKSLNMTENPKLTLVYATTGQWSGDENLEAMITVACTPLVATGYFESVQFKPYDRDLLKKTYRELRNSITRAVNFEKHTILPTIRDVDESFIGMLPASEFLKLISDDQGDMLRNIYYDNVRDFQGYNTVNSEIQETLLTVDNNDKFSILNNGVTIVAKSIKKRSTLFEISDYQIVNGCQTSHVIYYNRKSITPEIYVPIKLIVTQNYDLMSKIIRANNRQTTVSSEAFEILSPFHKYLEEYYVAMFKRHGIELYYERRSNQYEPQKINRNKYITLSNQITSFVAMFLNEPHSAGSRYFGELLQLYKTKLFIDGHSAFPYYISGLCMSKLESRFQSRQIPISYKRFKYHIMMIIRCSITQSELPKMNSRDMEKNCQAILDVVSDDQRFDQAIASATGLIDGILEQNPELFRNAHGSPKFTELILPAYEAQKASGRISYYNTNRGFGYISVTDTQDLFFHISDYHNSIAGDPVVGSVVKFDIVDSERGLRAINLLLPN